MTSMMAAAAASNSIIKMTIAKWREWDIYSEALQATNKRNVTSLEAIVQPIFKNPIWHESDNFWEFSLKI